MAENRHQAARDLIAANDNVNTLHKAGLPVTRTDLDRLSEARQEYDTKTAESK